jgi:hypothetical protein
MNRRASVAGLMRMLVVIGVLAGCGGAPATSTRSPSARPTETARAPEASEPRDPPCLPFTERSIRSRVDQANMLIEQVTSTGACEGQPQTTVTVLAWLAMPKRPIACPVGQMAIRMWDRGHGSVDMLPEFMAALASEDRAELRQALMYFADSAEAYVIGCRGPGHADYLIVESVPQNQSAKMQLFIRNKLDPDREHSAVHFVTAGP